MTCHEILTDLLDRARKAGLTDLRIEVDAIAFYALKDEVMSPYVAMHPHFKYVAQLRFQEGRIDAAFQGVPIYGVHRAHGIKVRGRWRRK